jgi:hypothetical protein
MYLYFIVIKVYGQHVTLNTCSSCRSKHGGARDKFLVTHPMTDQCCLASAIVLRAH